MLAKRDLGYLRWPLMALAVVILFAGLLIWYVEDWLANTNQLVQASKFARSDAQQSLDKVQEEEAQIKQYLARYSKWDELGAFSEFERAWVADRIDATLKLLPNTAIKYKIGARTDFLDLEGDVSNADVYKVYQYNIDIIGRVAHEESLLQLAQGLRANLRGPLSWETCRLSRTTSESRGGLPYVKTECTLTWTIIDKPEDSGGAPPLTPNQ